MARTPCQYGEKCYQKNPEHKEQFSHPGDADYEETTGYQATDVPAAPFAEGESVEDKGLLGAAGGAAAVAAGLGGAKMMGAFDKKENGKPGFVQNHPGLALVAGAAAVGVGAFAGHKLQDGLSGDSGKKPGKNSSGGIMGIVPGMGGKNKKGKEGKAKKEKKGGKDKKDKKTKSRGLEVGERGLDLDAEDSDSDTDSSSEESAEEQQHEEKH